MSAKKLLMAHCYSLHGHEKVHVFWYILNYTSKLSRPHKIDRTYLTTTRSSFAAVVQLNGLTVLRRLRPHYTMNSYQVKGVVDFFVGGDRPK